MEACGFVDRLAAHNSTGAASIAGWLSCMFPGLLVAHHGVERDQDFAHHGGKRDLSGPVIDAGEALVEAAHDRVPADRGAGGVEQHAAHAGPAVAGDGADRVLPLSRVCGASPTRAAISLPERRPSSGSSASMVWAQTGPTPITVCKFLRAAAAPGRPRSRRRSRPRAGRARFRALRSPARGFA